ncbi:CLUMA_CG007855, isoform A [Clunio marinus]|uniref:CLUMA_CG007855, isoform A n=1 Tax=Clunio marinus TaxID=568069 RepID=A0A1J1I413_9DIPT|nr:CLUMA_CG007855, isoform A [Clunio marinus]
MQLEHYIQLLHSGEFRQFDYRWKNLARYNMTTPPRYNLEAITIPIYIYTGKEDLLISPIDVNRLVRTLPNVQHYELVRNYNHIDFTYAKSARKNVYKKILGFIENPKENQ